MKKQILFALAILLIASGSVFAQENNPVKVKTKFSEKGGKGNFSIGGWKGNKLVWEKLWTDITMTELNPYSPHTIHEGAVFVVVKGFLYSIDLASGKINFGGKAKVGYCSHKPVIGKDGTIYCAGYYGPVITAVSPEGKVKWSYDNDDMAWIEDVQLKGKRIRVFHYGADLEQKKVSTFSKSGKLLKTEKRK